MKGTAQRLETKNNLSLHLYISPHSRCLDVNVAVAPLQKHFCYKQDDNNQNSLMHGICTKQFSSTYLMCVSSPGLTMLNTSSFIFQSPLGKMYFREGKEKAIGKAAPYHLKNPKPPKINFLLPKHEEYPEHCAFKALLYLLFIAMKQTKKTMTILRFWRRTRAAHSAQTGNLAMKTLSQDLAECREQHLLMRNSSGRFQAGRSQSCKEQGQYLAHPLNKCQHSRILYLFSFAFKNQNFPFYLLLFCGLRTLTATHEDGTAGRSAESWDCCFFEKGSERSTQKKMRVAIMSLCKRETSLQSRGVEKH
ncbi:hypothetical protein EK904_003774 [Melospiza melodia maxima]|nr:hypothetical protein EK904_003774 [Melospiza melodia maxima]